MAITKVEGSGGLLARLTDSNNYNDYWNMSGDYQTSKTPITIKLSSLDLSVTISRAMFFDPTPAGTYIPTEIFAAYNLNTQLLFFEMFDLGTLTLGDGAGGASSFADGTTMPTRSTSLATSEIQYGMIIAEVTEALNSAPGTFTITYDGLNSSGSTVTSQTSSAMTPANSSSKYSCGTVILNTTHIGVSDITAASRSGGTNPSGKIKFWGCLPIDVLATHQVSQGQSALFDQGKFIRIPSSSTIGCFSTNTTSAQGGMGFIKVVKE